MFFTNMSIATFVDRVVIHRLLFSKNEYKQKEAGMTILKSIVQT